MDLKDYVGKFEVFDSFFINKRKQFYLLGEMSEGELKENYYIQIQLNGSMTLSCKIDEVDEVEFAVSGEVYKLIIINCDEEKLELLGALRVGSEIVYITSTGED